jgi:maltooligosyltrehalose trehalohydrolase
MLLSPYVPLLFMGEEYGETNPFLYFVSHGDPDLIKAVREGRRKEFAAFGWGDEVPDPQSPETFGQSRLQRARVSDPVHAGILALYTALIDLRRREPALRPGENEAFVAHDEQARWITMELTCARGRPLFVLFNLSDEAQPIPAARRGRGRWTVCLTTEDELFGGGGGTVPHLPHNDPAGTVMVPAWSATVYGPEESR